MNPLDLVPSWGWAGLVGALAIAAGVQTVRLAEEEGATERVRTTLANERADRARETTQRAQVALGETTNVLKQERQGAAQSFGVERDAQTQARAGAAVAGVAQRGTAGLLQRLTDLDAAARASGLPTAAACPAEFERQRDAAIVARGLFGACVQEYRGLAEEADGVALKLDTALNYIAIEHPEIRPP